MTGIERLRELAGDYKNLSTKQKCIGIDTRREADLLNDIADQIERETQPRSDHAADVSVSAYDLLPEDERDAIAWVRDHGGLDHVKAEWRSRVPYERYERRRQNLLRHIAECETALGRRRRRIEELGHRVRDLTNENAELRRRAMPEGMEWLIEAWPKFEDGEPVRVGDEVCGGGRAFIVDHVVLFSNGESTVCAEADMDSGKVRDYARVRPSYRLKRPAPKLLDADGAEIELGDDLYGCESGRGPFRVSGVLSDSAEVKLMSYLDGSEFTTCAATFTHRAPVLAADGRPLREGETVWDIEDEKGYPHTVTSTELDGLGHVKTTCEEPTPASVSIHPSRLTHERPEVDSWSRLEEDAKLSLCEYNLRHKPAVGDGTTLGEDVRVDLVRRCRALAERERGE